MSETAPSPYGEPTFGLFDPAVDLRSERIEGQGPELVLGLFRENQVEFRCELEHEWDGATLLRLVLNER